MSKWLEDRDHLVQTIINEWVKEGLITPGERFYREHQGRATVAANVVMDRVASSV